MKHVGLLVIAGCVLTACSDDSPEPEQKDTSADPLAPHYAEILDYYGQLYNTIDASIEDDKSEDYYEGIADNAKITLQTALVYDQIDDLSYDHLSE
ncbi:hypothetical protein GCM10010954_30040 [Halobacillus andaensis]|uniref:Uncharacterized protein n=1 Tax=Halobacillus andaensis TaxID=1176239 RepID=A0A917B947_HALAA|nr:hypothetical protein [Halobacillus andaensis]MBP2005107.1 hypothetical protein [Halobacillus andaensis]GGF28922.1 hypothetical protein GCM10010954_30040 [Halobacillus andaensis]